ncbi:MAG: hypothetical protein JXA13_17620 [Anaerolineales bacterium]|nr:hypothetical protein [Anaerolineales bacterium]
MPDLEFTLAGKADNADLRRLLQENPFPGHIQVTLEREPNFFLAAPLEGDEHQTVIVRERTTRRIVVMVSRAVRKVYLNGQIRSLGYLSQLRITQGYRALPRMIIRVSQMLEELDRLSDTHLYLVSIIEDNLPARKFLTSGLPNMATLRAFARYHTLALYTRRKRLPHPLPRNLRLVQGSVETLPQILKCLERSGRRYQLAPRWTEKTLCHPEHTPGLRPHDFWLVCDADTVVGCAALWDQSSVKQTVVRNYTGWMGTFRPMINSFSWLLGTPKLPAPNEPFRFGYLSHLAADSDNPVVFSALIRQIYCLAVARQDSYLMLGLAEDHPHFMIARREYPHIDYPSQLYLAGWFEIDPQLAMLDNRPVGIEAGVL